MAKEGFIYGHVVVSPEKHIAISLILLATGKLHYVPQQI